ncbi:MAG: mycofactocin biosynthesis chaperone MftB [Patulibacter sp.]|nr:mycofactocin biosynthesis chaperone MftB [Patulibacter sp.]
MTSASEPDSAVPAGDQPAAQVDLDGPWMLSPQVALRPERFGALAYHFGTRRLSFLKSPQLLAVVEALTDHATVRDACRAVGVTDAELPTYESALGTLARTDMIVPRSPA